MARSRAALAAGCALGVLVILAAWEVAASALYCAIIGRPDAFAAPWMQWLTVAPYWRANWFVTLAVVGSAAGPLLPSAAVAAIVYRCRAGRPGQRALYGASAWASDGEMRRGGIKQTRRPF